MGLALSVIECQHCYDKPKVRKNQERFAKFTVYSKNIIRQTNVQFFSADEARARGEFRRLRTAGTVSKRIDTPYGGFYPLGTPSSAL